MRLLLFIGLTSALAFGQLKSAKDKATLESYVRQSLAWGPQIKVEVQDAKPAPLPGFVEMAVKGSANNVTQDEIFYISNDGQKIVRGTVFDGKSNPFKQNLDKIKADFTSANLGTAGAPVVMVMYSDFQCSFCRAEAKMLRENLLKAYPKEVRLYFKDFPLEQLHDWAKQAAIAGRCVFQQDAQKFWDYHDTIFEKQGEINLANLKGIVQAWAATKGLDSLQLTRCMDQKSTEKEVERSQEEGRSLGVNSTPTIYINGRKVSGNMQWDTLKQLIDAEIKYQKTAKNAGEDCGCTIELPSLVK
jgi:protein-disulfide isomerase